MCYCFSLKSLTILVHHGRKKKLLFDISEVKKVIFYKLFFFFNVGFNFPNNWIARNS